MIPFETVREIALDFAAAHPGQAWVHETPDGPTLMTHGATREDAAALALIFHERIRAHLRNIGALERALKATPTP